VGPDDQGVGGMSRRLRRTPGRAGWTAVVRLIEGLQASQVPEPSSPRSQAGPSVVRMMSRPFTNAATAPVPAMRTAPSGSVVTSRVEGEQVRAHVQVLKTRTQRQLNSAVELRICDRSAG